MSEQAMSWGEASGGTEVAASRLDGSRRFAVDVPMESAMEREFPALPWEANRQTIPLDPPSTVSSVGANVTIVVPPTAVRAARRYMESIAPRLPADVREAIIQGAGLFDFPAPDDDDLDGLLD